MTGLEIALVAASALLLAYVPGSAIRRWLKAKKRKEALPGVAEQLGLTHDPSVHFRIPAELLKFDLFAFSEAGARTMHDVMSGRTGDVDVRVFDVQFGTGTAKHHVVIGQTVIEAASEAFAFPRFRLEPEEILHKVSEVFSAQDIDFDSHPRFSDAYLLRGPDEAAIRAAFTPTVLSWFEANVGLTIEAEGDRMIMYRTSHLTPPEEIPADVELTVEAARVFGA